ncbi:hypothetical protein SEA_SPILLED_136 [Streptomyces phage Spilled]|uniref:Uncharacterized protein n=1 Tax=Streptomyces phage Karimac TaxID=2283303 RepID=A0A345MHT0_9CAUD|nr:hypothetical protein HWB80_gp159 [Streptomyces phage Karimac]AXH70111.1 hypothetical protein SEA_KARIMAC_132 [Streptomyces phage Karimac]UVK60020.1 hypothetical protein SEA_SPILLED_136 [Streptomyces phage Spilled]
MSYETRTYRFTGSMKLADEIVMLAIKYGLRVSKRTNSGLIKKSHFLEIFGDTPAFGRFESAKDSTQRRLK